MKNLVVLFLLITNMGLAQESKPNHVQKTKVMQKHLVQKLNLNQVQAQKVKVLHEEFKSQTQELRQSKSAQKQQIDNDMHQLRNTLNSEMKKVLTAEQFIDYKKLQVRKRKRKTSKGDNHEGRRPY